MYKVFCLLLLLTGGTAAFAQTRLTEPEFRLTHEGYEVTSEEGMYIPKEGYFQIDLRNHDEIYARLPSDAYISFISSEARLLKPNAAPMSLIKDQEFIESELDLM
ncbi:MAG: hypothetical protein WBA12_09945, partial [Catalinimonas sp.]